MATNNSLFPMYQQTTKSNNVVLPDYLKSVYNYTPAKTEKFQSTSVTVPPKPVTTTGQTGTGTVTTNTNQPKPVVTNPAMVTLPDGKQIEGYVKNGSTYYMQNGVETRVPTGALVKVGNKTFQRTETGGQLLEGADLLTAQSNIEAKQQTNVAMENLTNFQNRLLAQRDQGILQAQRGAEMARGGLQNQMFQNWLGARQAMTERGMTGSGIAQDANTRLQLAGQQQLAELYTNLSNQINAIDSNYQLSNQEKEQEKLNLQNSFFQLRDQIFQGKQTAALAAQESQAKVDQQNNESRLAWAKVFGFDPENPDLPTLEAQKFAEDKAENLRKYGISLADVTGYIPFTNEKGETVSLPTLEREIFVDGQQRAVADRQAANIRHANDLTAKGQIAQAEDYRENVKNVENSLNNLLDFYKGAYDTSLRNYQDLKANPPDNKASKAENDKYNSDLAQAETDMKTAYSNWMATGAKYAEYNSNPVAYVKKVSGG